MTQHKFNATLLGQAGSEVAALKPPFDVIEVFHRRAEYRSKGRSTVFPSAVH